MKILNAPQSEGFIGYRFLDGFLGENGSWGHVCAATCWLRIKPGFVATQRHLLKPNWMEANLDQGSHLCTRRIQTLPKPFDLLPEPPIADPAISARVMKLVRTADIKSAASSNACRFDPASGANDDQSLAQASTASYRSFF